MNRVVLEVDDSLVLRQFTEQDADVIFACIDTSREHLSQFGDRTASKYPTIDHVRDSIINPRSKNRIRLGIWDDNIFVGVINLEVNVRNIGKDVAEVGYWLGRQYQGKGYVSRSLQRVLRYGYEDLHLRNILARIDIRNQRSKKVLEKAGFRRNITLSNQDVLYGRTEDK